MTQRILVVDDQEENRQILHDLLSSAGLTLIEAVNGAEAIDLAERERPDLILMDMQMPIINGYDATRRIKAIPALSRIPIIAVTSYALNGDEAKAREAGCDDYVPKPYSPRALLSKVLRHLEDAR
jgi:two-component system, cell cycle response regulator DivK